MGPDAADPFRARHRVLSDEERAFLDELKSAATALWDLIELVDAPREKALARTKLQESIMWAVRGVTG